MPPATATTSAIRRIVHLRPFGVANVTHEPHSPTPYLVKRAVSWGDMTLTELLRELVNDDNNLKAILSLLGLKGDGSR